MQLELHKSFFIVFFETKKEYYDLLLFCYKFKKTLPIELVISSEFKKLQEHLYYNK